MENVQQMIAAVQILLTLAIAAFVALVAWRQHKTDRDKVRLDLFDKRFASYEALRRFLKMIMSNPAGLNELQQLYEETSTMSFLFGSDINDYRRKLHHNAVRLRTVDHMVDDLKNDDERSDLLEEREKLQKWLINQFRDMPKEFEKYLIFKDFTK